MTLVEVYSKADCHLCEAAEDILRRIQARHPFELKIIHLTEGDDRFQEFRERFPVIAIDHKVAYQYRVPEEEFIRKLQESEREERQ